MSKRGWIPGSGGAWRAYLAIAPLVIAMPRVASAEVAPFGTGDVSEDGEGGVPAPPPDTDDARFDPDGATFAFDTDDAIFDTAWDVPEADPDPTCDPGMVAQTCWDGIGKACGLHWCGSDFECGAGEACIQRLVGDQTVTCTNGQQGSVTLPCEAAGGAAKAPPPDPADPRDPAIPPPGGTCYAAQVCGDRADALCPVGQYAQVCSAEEQIQCGLMQCFSDGSCMPGQVCRARYARTVDMPCAGGWSNSVTVACVLGEPDCGAIAVCVPNETPVAEGDGDTGPDVRVETFADTAPDSATSEPRVFRGDDTSGCAGNGAGAWLVMAGFAWVKRSRRGRVLMTSTALVALAIAWPSVARAVPMPPDAGGANADVGMPDTPPPDCGPGFAPQFCGRAWVCAVKSCFSDAECTGGLVCVEQPVTSVVTTCPDGSQRSLAARCDQADLASCYPGGLCSPPEERICDDAKALRICGAELRCALRRCTNDFQCQTGEACRARYVRADEWTCDGNQVEALAACTLGDSGCGADTVCVLGDSEPGPELGPEVGIEGGPDEPPEAVTDTDTRAAEPAEGIAGTPAAGCGAAPGWVDPAMWVFAMGVALGLRRRGER